MDERMSTSTSTNGPSAAEPLRIGTRGSPLALAQAGMAAAAIGAHHAMGDSALSIRTFRTTGDRVQDRALAEIGGKALWTRELDRALLEGEIDIAVHSMKDVETVMAAGIRLAAVLPRADARDRLIGADSVAALPPGALVGTSSPRREAQLLHRRPDVRVALLRGNVETRLRRVAEGDFAATFLAAAGLARLGMDAGVAMALDDWLPAASQGVVGIACREGDTQTMALLAAIDDRETHMCLNAERAVLAALGGSCRTAVAVHARMTGAETLTLQAELLTPDGREAVRAGASGSDPAALGGAVGAELLATASPAMLATLSPP